MHEYPELSDTPPPHTAIFASGKNTKDRRFLRIFGDTLQREMKALRDNEMKSKEAFLHARATTSSSTNWI